MSGDPYRTAASKVFNDRAHGIWLLLDQVISVATYRDEPSKSSICIKLRNGQEVSMSWDNRDEAGKLYKSLTEALEEFNR